MRAVGCFRVKTGLIKESQEVEKPGQGTGGVYSNLYGSCNNQKSVFVVLEKVILNQYSNIQGIRETDLCIAIETIIASGIV